MLRFVLPVLAFGLVSMGAHAQGPALPAGTSSYAPATPDPASRWEARFGFGAADVRGRESGLANVAGEVLTPKPFALDDRFANAFVPRFHIGASGNFNGTRYAYAGATWQIDLTRTVFVEGSLGAAINDGKTGLVVPQNRLDLGCNAGTRAAGSLGVRLSDRWSLVATLEHFSAGTCGGKELSSGPANVGARIGYTF